jgi:hypothetical protein
MSERLLIGYANGKPVYRIAGGSAMFPADNPAGGGGDDEIEVDDPTQDPPSDDPDDDADDDDTRASGDDGYVPPDKITWDKMRAAVKNQRREIKILKREYEEKVKNLTSTASATNEVEVEKARIAERNSRDAYWTEEIVRAKAAAEFTAQGASAEMGERLALMVNLKKVEWDEREREFDGLQDEIDEIVEANPDFFKSKSQNEDPAPRRGGIPRPRVDGAPRGPGSGGAPRRRPSSAQLLANQALGTKTRRR